MQARLLIRASPFETPASQAPQGEGRERRMRPFAAHQD